MRYDFNEVFEIDKPQEVFLPNINVSSKYIFAKEDFFFAYPNNYNFFVNHYKETLQHGGVSLEEMFARTFEDRCGLYFLSFARQMFH